MARILVIDDEPLLLESIELMLLASGHVVTTAANGRLAAKLFNAQTFDLIITDMVMPDREGIETVITVHRDFPAVGVIAMSGGVIGSSDYLHMAARLGAHRTLSKPFTADMLHVAIAATLAAVKN
jgi:DNA-binding response OmpR family regulator